MKEKHLMQPWLIFVTFYNVQTNYKQLNLQIWDSYSLLFCNISVKSC